MQKPLMFPKWFNTKKVKMDFRVQHFLLSFYRHFSWKAMSEIFQKYCRYNVPPVFSVRVVKDGIFIDPFWCDLWGAKSASRRIADGAVLFRLFSFNSFFATGYSCWKLFSVSGYCQGQKKAPVNLL